MCVCSDSPSVLSPRWKGRNLHSHTLPFDLGPVGSVNECFAADKQNICNKKFFFIFSLSVWSVFYATRPFIHSLLCFIRLLYIQSDVLWGIRCPDVLFLYASVRECPSAARAACLRRFLLLFTVGFPFAVFPGGVRGVWKWNRWIEQTYVQMLIVVRHCQQPKTVEELRKFQPDSLISFTNFSLLFLPNETDSVSENSHNMSVRSLNL